MRWEMPDHVLGKEQEGVLAPDSNHESTKGTPLLLLSVCGTSFLFLRLAVQICECREALPVG
jgi:hypothetical protein